MGLRINSFAGLQSARDYRLCLLTYRLEAGSPEARIVGRYFEFMADALGADGMIVTGGYDETFRDDPSGFLRAVVLALHEVNIDSRLSEGLTSPALVALRASDGGHPAIGYFPIRGLGEAGVVELFRKIQEASKVDGGIEALDGNLLGRKGNAATELWAALQLKPGFLGFGIDLKGPIERAYRGLRKARKT